MISYDRKDDHCDVVINGEIWDYMAEELREAVAGCKSVALELTTVGGDAFAGLSMRQTLSSIESVVVTAISLCASAGIFLLLGDYKTRADESCVFMTHRGSSFAAGNSEDLRAGAEALEIVDMTVAKAFAKKTKMSDEDVREWFSVDRYFDADTAQEMGLISEKLEDSKGEKSSSRMVASFKGLKVQNKGGHKMPEDEKKEDVVIDVAEAAEEVEAVKACDLSEIRASFQNDASATMIIDCVEKGTICASVAMPALIKSLQAKMAAEVASIKASASMPDPMAHRTAQAPQSKGLVFKNADGSVKKER